MGTSISTAEGLAAVPVGAIVESTDGSVAWRKHGKADWERLRPSSDGWTPTRPPERGARTFQSVLREAQHGGLRMVPSEQREVRAYRAPGLRTQDGNIVVITSPDGRGYEVYENEKGLEMYLFTVPKSKINAVRDTLVRIAILKHEKAEIEAARRVVGRFLSKR